MKITLAIVLVISPAALVLAGCWYGKPAPALHQYEPITDVECSLARDYARYRLGRVRGCRQ